MVKQKIVNPIEIASTPERMQNHLRREHLMMKKLKMQYPCDKCSKIFADKPGLNIHKNAIHDEQKFKCEHCDKTYSRKQVLRNHIRMVHLNFRVSCDICDKTYSTTNKLKEHVIIKHENGNGLK